MAWPPAALVPGSGNVAYHRSSSTGAGSSGPAARTMLSNQTSGSFSRCGGSPADSSIGEDVKCSDVQSCARGLRSTGPQKATGS